MADSNELNSDGAERKIPVFTVFKNNTIFKNIFVVDRPPSVDEDNPVDFADKPIDHEFEEVLLVGRHPDCNITLENPSISRFHLRIHSKPSLQMISVVDLASVHGTRVCGIKIEPGVQVRLNEGDSLQLGGSSRTYVLHWIPISAAYDLEKPFLPPLDTYMDTEEMEDEGNFQDDDYIVTLADDLEGENPLFSHENSKPQLENLLPSLVYEDTENKDDEVSPLLDAHLGTKNSSFVEMSQSPQPSFDEVENDQKSILLEMDTEEMEDEGNFQDDSYIVTLANDLEGENPLFSHENSKPQLENLVPSLVYEDTENKDHIADDEVSLLLDAHLGTKNSSFVEMSQTPQPSFAEVENDQKSILLETEIDCKSEIDDLCYDPIEEFVNLSLDTKITCEKEVPESPDQKSNCSSIWSRRGKPSTAIKVQASKIGVEMKSQKIGSPRALFTGFEEEEEEIFTPDKENFTPKTLLLRAMKKKKMDNRQGDEIKSPKPLFTGFVEEEEEEEIFTPDKENITPNTLRLRSMKKKMDKNDQEIKPFTTFKGSSSAKSKSSISIKDEEEESFTPDNENIIPNTISLKSSIKKKCSMSRTPFADSSTFSKMKQTRTRFVESSKKLQDSKTQLAMDTMKIRNERVPFQPLLVDSVGKKNTEASDSLWKRKPVSRRWTMVVDTNCLIDKKSINSLRLLQGIKGTQLVVPRIVIRELNCLKRRGSLFRRPSSEAAALALEWIEECMLSTSWWIRVQCFGEEERKVAETPPASPQFSAEERVGFDGFVGFVGFPLTPLAEDQILECGLLFRKINCGGRLVLLTDDVTLKIKAMAEGLLCETVEEFRGSLVNPFSERFLWVNSLPRGATWTYLDDVVLRKIYDSHLTKKTTARSFGDGGAKGLKLILQYKVGPGR